MNVLMKYCNVDFSIGNICFVLFIREIIWKINLFWVVILRLIFIYKKFVYKLICELGVL